MSMTVIFNLRKGEAKKLSYNDTNELDLNLRAMLTDKEIFIIEVGDVSYDLGTAAGHLEADVEVMDTLEVYVTFYTGSGSFTVRTGEGYGLSFKVDGHKLIIDKEPLE